MSNRPPIKTLKHAYASMPNRAMSVRDRDELQRLIVSRFPVIYFDAREEGRAERLVGAVARACSRSLWQWSLSTGVVPLGDNRTDPATFQLVPALQRIAEQPGDNIFIMRDAAQLIADEPTAQRILRDIAAASSGTTLIILGACDVIPEQLRSTSAKLELDLPDRTIIASHINAVIARSASMFGARSGLSAEGFTRLAEALRGLTLDEIDQVLLHLIYDDDQIDDTDIEEAIAQKAKILSRGGVLSLETPTVGLDWVAGMSNVKEWAAIRARAFSEEAKEYGISPPRGIVLTGVPGCGKSFVAKALAFDWDMPLLRLDGGSLYDSYIGASERNLNEALRTANSLAPCVLWIDEIEKGFGSTGPSQSDGGLSYRLLGTLATWMQERPSPVFLVATSNDVLKLPPELVRQGRFDEIFFVGLPDEVSREHLFRMQFSRTKRDFQNFDCHRLATLTDGFSGAEIEQAVTNGLYTAFSQGREVTTEDVATEIARTNPLSRVDPTRIDQICQWGETHARPA